jgi:hypothetical protein
MIPEKGRYLGKGEGVRPLSLASDMIPEKGRYLGKGEGV